MPTKKRFFKRNKEKETVGNKSVKSREKRAVVVKSSNNKNEPPKPQLPNISRIITESKLKLPAYHITKQWLLYLKLTTVILAGLLVIWLGIQVGVQIAGLLKVSSQRQLIQAKRDTWEDIAQKYPTYRDAYFQVALLSYQLGDSNTQLEYLQKTLAIDPNFAPAKNMSQNF